MAFYNPYDNSSDEERSSSGGDESKQESESESEIMKTIHSRGESAKRKRNTTGPKASRKRTKKVPKPLYNAEVIEIATGSNDESEDMSKLDKADSNILARIRKAMKLATHPGTGEAEAKLAMRMATKLMASQNLTQADLIANETAEERATRAGNSKVRINSTTGKKVNNQRWFGRAASAACEAFDVQVYSSSSERRDQLDWVFYGLADNTVAAALAFEMLHNQVELWATEKKGELKGRTSGNSYRIGVAERVEMNAQIANRQALLQAEEDEKKRIKEETAAAEAARAAEIERLAMPVLPVEVTESNVKVEDEPEEDTFQPKVTVKNEPDEDAQVTTEVLAEVPVDATGMGDGDDSDNEAGLLPMDYDLKGDNCVDFDDGDAPDVDLDALEQKINDQSKSTDPSAVPSRRRKYHAPLFPEIVPPAPVETPPVEKTEDPVPSITPEPTVKDNTVHWTSALQLRTFRDNAKTIAETYLKESGTKLSKERKRAKLNVNKEAYYKGWDDGQKVDLKRRRIEGQDKEEGESMVN